MNKMIQVRDVPAKVHAVLRTRAAKAGMSLSEFLLAELRKLAERPTMEEALERIAQREPVELRPSPAKVLRAERDAR
jgi:plasmid stability protein